MVKGVPSVQIDCLICVKCDAQPERSGEAAECLVARFTDDRVEDSSAYLVSSNSSVNSRSLLEVWNLQIIPVSKTGDRSPGSKCGDSSAEGIRGTLG